MLFRKPSRVFLKECLYLFSVLLETFSVREVKRPPKVGIYIKWKRSCEEVFQDPLRLHILFLGIVDGRFKCGKK